MKLDLAKTEAKKMLALATNQNLVLLDASSEDWQVELLRLEMVQARRNQIKVSSLEAFVAKMDLKKLEKAVSASTEWVMMGTKAFAQKWKSAAVLTILVMFSD